MILKSAIVLILIFCLYILSCTFVNGKNTKSSEKDITAIKKFLEQSGEAVNNGDVEAEVNRFTEDGIYMWPDAPSIIGHDSLRKWFQLRFEKADVMISSNHSFENIGVKSMWPSLQVTSASLKIQNMYEHVNPFKIKFSSY